MSIQNRTSWLRSVAAYDLLRGRPPKPDYGLLVVLPFLAAAGGVLVGLGLESMVDRRRGGGPHVPRNVPA
jgi:hypothetical protein